MATVYTYDGIRVNGVTPKGVTLNGNPVTRMQVGGVDLIHRTDTTTTNVAVTVYVKLTFYIQAYNFRGRLDEDEYGYYYENRDYMMFDGNCQFKVTAWTNNSNFQIQKLIFSNNASHSIGDIYYCGTRILYLDQELSPNHVHEFTVSGIESEDLTGFNDLNFDAIINGTRYKAISFFDPVQGNRCFLTFSEVERQDSYLRIKSEFQKRLNEAEWRQFNPTLITAGPLHEARPTYDITEYQTAYTLNMSSTSTSRIY